MSIEVACPTFPTLAWIKHELRCGIPRVRQSVRAIYVIGSRARGDHREDSDIDIAVVIDPFKSMTALAFSEQYHFTRGFKGWKLPKWQGLSVDLQFFYPGDESLAQYSKVTIWEEAQS